MPFFKGEVKESPRKEFLYWSDDGDLLALRVQEWKIVFKEQEHTGIDVWRREFTNLRAPKIYNLRADPFERGDASIEYDKWMADRAFLIVPSQAVVGAVARELQGIPDPAEARELQSGRGDAETVAEAVARQEHRGAQTRGSCGDG